MTTNESILSQLTSPHIVKELREFLRERDPDFLRVEEKFQTAILQMRKTIGREAVEKLQVAWDQQICSDLVYAGYQGFQKNLQNFYYPRNEALEIPEHIISVLPNRVKAAARAKQFSELTKPYEEDIWEYYIFLETVGPKLACFWGYQFANHFLPWVIPGYVVDEAQTNLYRLCLNRHFGFLVE